MGTFVAAYLVVWTAACGCFARLELRQRRLRQELKDVQLQRGLLRGGHDPISKAA